MIAVIKKKEKSTVPKKEFSLSHYQSRIFDWAKNGSGNAVVNATAGSGKTTTAVKLIEYLEGSVLFVAFNKHIAEELQRRVESATVKTVHSLGFSALSKYLGKTKLDSYKYANLCQEEAQQTISEHCPESEPWELRKKCQNLKDVLVDLLRFSQNCLVPGEDVTGMKELANAYGVDCDEWDFELLCESVSRIQNLGQTISEDEKIIDFIDMIWLPCIWELTVTPFDWVVGDEIQDWSKCQLELVSRAVNGRFIGVGDPRQSIYLFSGADSASFENIRQKFDAVELPLSICYRCPTSHLEIAREIEPKIEAAETAIAGTVSDIKRSDVATEVKIGDLILCRLTAPLLSLCIQLIAKKVPAKVIGRDISKHLSKIVGEITSLHGFEWDNFPAWAEEYYDRKAKKLSDNQKSEARIQTLRDTVDGVIACYEGFEADSAFALNTQIKELFTDDTAMVTLCTVHRAKGLEADRVFVLRPEKMPLKWKDQLPTEAEQELNIKFVAVTRSKKDLFFVHGEE
jgi:superfamily I DNA/RNA helicase